MKYYSDIRNVTSLKRIIKNDNSIRYLEILSLCLYSEVLFCCFIFSFKPNKKVVALSLTVLRTFDICCAVSLHKKHCSFYHGIMLFFVHAHKYLPLPLIKLNPLWRMSGNALHILNNLVEDRYKQSPVLTK